MYEEDKHSKHLRERDGYFPINKYDIYDSFINYVTEEKGSCISCYNNYFTDFIALYSWFSPELQSEVNKLFMLIDTERVRYSRPINIVTRAIEIIINNIKTYDKFLRNVQIVFGIVNFLAYIFKIQLNSHNENDDTKRLTSILNVCICNEKVITWYKIPNKNEYKVIYFSIKSEHVQYDSYPQMFFNEKIISISKISNNQLKYYAQIGKQRKLLRNFNPDDKTPEGYKNNFDILNEILCKKLRKVPAVVEPKICCWHSRNNSKNHTKCKCSLCTKIYNHLVNLNRLCPDGKRAFKEPRQISQFIIRRRNSAKTKYSLKFSIEKAYEKIKNYSVDKNSDSFNRIVKDIDNCLRLLK